MSIQDIQDRPIELSPALKGSLITILLVFIGTAVEKYTCRTVSSTFLTTCSTHLKAIIAQMKSLGPVLQKLVSDFQSFSDRTISILSDIRRSLGVLIGNNSDYKSELQSTRLSVERLDNIMSKILFKLESQDQGNKLVTDDTQV